MSKPLHEGSFPLLGLEGQKVVILDDWCFDERVIIGNPIVVEQGHAMSIAPATKQQSAQWSPFV